ncbi:hypothetical protein ACWGNE_20265 [Streptomyces xiamenensis]
MTPTAGPAQGDHRATYREVPAEPRFRLLFTTRAAAITADLSLATPVLWHPPTSPVPAPHCSTGSENGTGQRACGSPAR